MSRSAGIACDRSRRGGAASDLPEPGSPEAGDRGIGMKLTATACRACTAVLSTAVVTAGPAAGAAGTSAAGMLNVALTRFPGFAPLADSRLLVTPVVLHGKLTDTSGAALAGAQVLMAAWPSNDTLHALPVGATFAVTPVARTVAALDGSYELRSPLTPLLASMTTRDGLDVELDVHHGGRHHTYLTQVVPDPASGGWVRRLLEGADAAAPTRQANPRNALHVALERDGGNRIGRDLLRYAMLPADHRPPAPPACSPYEKWAERSAMTTVATAVARNGVKVTTEYKRQATSELTTGASKDGSLVFVPSGSRSQTAGHGAEWEAEVKRGRTVAREYRVDWLHIVTKRLCAKDFRGNYEPALMTSPDRTTGGVAPANRNSRRYAAWKCEPKFVKEAGAGKVYTEDNRAYTYGADWTLPVTPQAGLTGSVRSGYGDEVKITFELLNPEQG